MAQSVEFLLDKLSGLRISHSDLITDARSQIESLERDLRKFRGFLKESDSEKKRGEDEHMQELVRSICDVVYEVEDTIDVFVAQATEAKANTFARFWKLPVMPHAICEKVEAVTKQIDRSNIDFAIPTTCDYQNDEIRVPRKKDIVGFDDETNVIIKYLTQQTEQLDVITLVGMPGIGKSTLAWKIFNDVRIALEFPIRIWVCFSNETKNLLLRILKVFLTSHEEVKDKSDEELADLVLSHLQSERFLIVFDDMLSASVWDRLRIALPESNKKGKVLITTCHEEVARRANRFRQPHKVPFMSYSDSWKLLEFEVFGPGNNCPPQLENIGKLIVKQCDGLPLAIVTAGEILCREGLSYVDIKARKIAWIKTGQRLLPKFRSMKVYNHLPSHLQVCFLYLAVFPYDCEIPVEQLIRMWIAEGFVRQGDDGSSLEETAYNYLEDLFSRNLVIVSQIKANGRVKTCRIHRILHEFCKTQAGNKRENILTEIKFSDGVFEPPISQLSESRRLSIHSIDILDFLSLKPSIPRVRSLLSFSKETICLPAETNSAITAAFKLVRVLNVKPVKFSTLPRDMYRLVHLTYLAFSSDITNLPTSFSKLRNIQTLLVDTTSPVLEVKPDILGLIELRHFKTNASANLCKLGKTGEGGENFQSLGTILPESCTKELFSRASNLKKLSIRGKTSLLLEGKIGSIDCLVKLTSLENLKLLNVAYPSPLSEGRLRSLPPADKFPPSLRSITLARTYLNWDQMYILGSLQMLQVLKLRDNAFVGQYWVTDEGHFPNLETLHIGKTDLVVWAASADHFPRLRSLKLHHCEQIQEVPIELADITSLRLLDLFDTKRAADSAKRFLQRKQKLLKGQMVDEEEFKLSMYP